MSGCIRKIEKYLLALSIILLPFFGSLKFKLFGDIGKTAAVYPLILGMGIMFICCVKYNQVLILKDAITKLFMVFFIMCVLSYIVNVESICYFNYFKNQWGATRGIAQLVVLLFLGCISIYAYNAIRIYSYDEIMKFTNKCMIASFIIAGTYSLFELGVFGGLIGGEYLSYIDAIFRGEREYDVIYRIKSVAKEPSMFSIYCAVVIPWILINCYSRKINWIYMMMFLYSNVLLLLSFSRTGYITLIIEYIVYFFLCARFKIYSLKEKKKWVIAFIAVVIVGGIYIAANSDEFIVNPIYVISTIFSKDANMSNIARYGGQEAALNVFYNNPILGVGIGQFGFYAADNYPNIAWQSLEVNDWSLNDFGITAWPAAFSSYIRLLAEIGFLGTAVFLLMNIVLICNMIALISKQRLDYRKYSIAVLSGLVGLLVSGMSAETFTYIPMWIYIAFYWKTKNSIIEE